MELELGLQLLLQALPTIAEIFTSIQEEKVARIKHQQAKEAKNLSTNSVNWAFAQENLDFQRWRFEQEKSFQQQLAVYDRETQLQLASHQRETALQLPEIHKVLNNWPLRLFPSQLLDDRNINELIPLRFFLFPPKVQGDRSEDFAQAFSEIDLNLAQSLREFLRKHYPLHSLERPTEFLAGVWKKHFHREASIKALFKLLKSQPTLILESELVGDYLNFRIAYWGLGQKNYCYQTIISRMPYWEIVYASAKSRALKWKETANRLLACGESPEEVNKLAGDNYANLQILEKEEKWKLHGIDTSELALQYKVNSKDFAAFAQFLITAHCMVAGWVADAHHLIHYDVPPLLPELLPGLLQNAADQHLLQEVMQTTISGYKDIFKALETERPLWVPELALKLAQSLSHLPNKSWAKEQINYSLTAWLQQRQLPQLAGANFIEAMQPVLTIKDKPYLEKLKECFVALKDEQGVILVNELLLLVKDLENQANLASAALVQLENDQSIAPAHSDLSKVHLKSCTILNNGEAELLNSHSQADPGNEKSADLSRFDTGAISEVHPTFEPICSPEILPSNASENLKSKPLLENISLSHTITNHSGKASSIAINGQTIASGCDDDTIKLWHLESGELLHTLQGNSGRVLTIALSPDGQTLASSHRSSDRSCIKIWHLGTGELLRTLTGHHKWIYSLAISPDGNTLVSGGAKIKIWHLETGEALHTLPGHKKWVYSLAISPDEKTLVSSGGDKTIKIWHLPTGELLHSLEGHSDWVRTVAISPDGEILASGSDDNTIKLWELKTGKLLRTFTGHSDWVLSVAIGPDGQTLISGSKDHTIKLWDIDTKTLLRTLTEHQKWVYSLAVSPDGQTLASGSEDKTIKIWRAV